MASTEPTTTAIHGVPIAEDVFTWPSEEPRLIGSRCEDCATVTFPTQSGCPRCGSDRMERHLLGRQGTLWTFTTQGYLPKEPYTGPETEETFAGYGLGYVERPGEVRLEVVPASTMPESGSNCWFDERAVTTRLLAAVSMSFRVPTT